VQVKSCRRRLAEAVRWFRISAENGRFNGTAFYIGTGTEQDLVEAAQWFQRSTDLGSDDACAYKGTVLRCGGEEDGMQ
jgi:TPR repeat protein